MLKSDLNGQFGEQVSLRHHLSMRINIVLGNYVENPVGNFEVKFRMKHKNGHLVPILSKGKVLGFALYYTSYSTWKGQCLYLEDFLVTEKMRGNGIGKLLFDEIISIAKQRKVARFVWQILDWNEPALNFYRKYNADLDSGWVNGKLVF